MRARMTPAIHGACSAVCRSRAASLARGVLTHDTRPPAAPHTPFCEPLPQQRTGCVAAAVAEAAPQPPLSDASSAGALRATWRLAWSRAARGRATVAAADPAAPPYTLLVSAVALLDDTGRVLLAQRPAGKSQGGKWEFPGGKVENGESPEAALSRELQEELDIRVDVADLFPLAFSSVGGTSRALVLMLFGARRWERDIRGAEGQPVRWVVEAELGSDAYPMPEADVPMLPAVRAAMAAMAAGADTAAVAASANRATGAEIGAGLAAAAHKTHA